MPFLRSTAVSGKGPSQPAPRFIGNLIAYILNLVSVALLETTDWHHSENYFPHHNKFTADRPKRPGICTLFFRLPHHKELLICNAKMGKDQVLIPYLSFHP